MDESEEWRERGESESRIQVGSQESELFNTSRSVQLRRLIG